MAGNTWFEIDKEGLRKTLERRGKAFAIFELVQNAWDEDGTTEVSVQLTRPERGKSVLTVTDNAPEGYRDLSESYTMFAESYKKGDPAKRGRFNIGEKCVLALCDEATITTTTGRVTFDRDGTRRRTSAVKRDRGSEFRAELKLKLSEWEEICGNVMQLLPPVPTIFNSEPIPIRTPLTEYSTALPTEIADADGILRRTTRETEVRVYEPLPSETPMLYERGIPVVEGDKYHVDVQQKVPLNVERDNVTPAYLRAIRVAVLNATVNLLTKDDATEPWVKQAAGDERVAPGVPNTLLDLRYGDMRVIADPTDPEGTKIAVTKGYTVVHGGSLSAGEWANAKRDGAILPAGQVTPSPKPFSADGEPLPLIPHENWTVGMREFVRFAQELAQIVLGHGVAVEFTNHVAWNFRAAYGSDGQLIVSKVRHGGKWFDGEIVERTEDWAELLIHEFAHDTVSDHLSEQFHEECCRIGATYAAHLQRELGLASGDGLLRDQSANSVSAAPLEQTLTEGERV
jgi:hypothetical protein